MQKTRILPLSLICTFLFSGGASTSFAQIANDTIKFGADLRVRHELIDAEGKEQRNRQRVRARFNMTSKVNDDFNIGMQIATGTDNPVSTNQTFDNGFSTKDAKIDLAYFEWAPVKYSGVSVTGGKVKNPFYSPAKTQLMWDSDLRPEGLAFQYSKSRGSMEMFVNTSYFWVEERSEQGDAVLLGGQAGIDYTSPAGGLIIGAGYFDYQNTKNYPTFYKATDSAGNSADSTGNYLYDYDDLEIFAEISPAGVFNKCTVFLDYVSNIAADAEDNISWLAGFTVGKVKDPGSMDMRYSYRYVEKDAVIGAFTDSDFMGGGSNGQGHRIDLSYQVAAKTKAGLVMFLNRNGIDNGKDYTRIHFVINFKL
jgi:hypothetical protein